jgi:hypothetical protein
MAKPGDVVEAPEIGLRFECRDFLERLAELDYNRFGHPRPSSAARLVLD